MGIEGKILKAIWEEIKDSEVELSRREVSEKYNIPESLARNLVFLKDHREIFEPAELRQKVRRGKRVLLAGDFHCGHLAGLTPPEFQLNKTHPKYGRFAEFQRETWIWFYNEIQKLKPFDVAIYNGDLIDGRGEKSKSTELLTADRSLQADMAVQVIRTVGAKVNLLTYGTAYHTGKGEDYEEQIAKDVAAKAIEPELNVDVSGVIINVKHHTGNSSVPYGSATPLLKDAFWADLWADFEERPKADIVVRSHVHTFMKVHDRSRVAVSLPALQGALTKYGERRMTKIVDYGFVIVDVFQDGSFELKEKLFSPYSQRQKVIKI